MHTKDAGIQLSGVMLLALLVKGVKVTKKTPIAGVCLLDLKTGKTKEVGLAEASTYNLINATVKNSIVSGKGFSASRFPVYSLTTGSFVKEPVFILNKVLKEGEKEPLYTVICADGRIGVVIKGVVVTLANKKGCVNFKLVPIKGKSSVKVVSLSGALPVCTISNSAIKPPTSPKTSQEINSKLSKPTYFKKKKYAGLLFEEAVLEAYSSGRKPKTILLNKLATGDNYTNYYGGVKENFLSCVHSVNDINDANHISSFYNHLLWLPLIMGEPTSTNVMYEALSENNLDKFTCFKELRLLVTTGKSRLARANSQYARLSSNYQKYINADKESIAKRKEAGEYLSNIEFEVLRDVTLGVYDSNAQRKKRYLKYKERRLSFIRRRYSAFSKLPDTVNLPYFNDYIRRGKVDFVITNSKNNPLYSKLVFSSKDLITHLDILVLYTFAMKYKSNSGYVKESSDGSSFGVYIKEALHRVNVPSFLKEEVLKVLQGGN